MQNQREYFSQIIGFTKDIKLTNLESSWFVLVFYFIKRPLQPFSLMKWLVTQVSCAFLYLYLSSINYVLTLASNNNHPPPIFFPVITQQPPQLLCKLHVLSIMGVHVPKLLQNMIFQPILASEIHQLPSHPPQSSVTMTLLYQVPATTLPSAYLLGI